MKNLVLASLMALTVSQAAGCIISSGDDSEDAYISATWQIRSEAQNSKLSCPQGFDTARLYNQPVDANGNNAGPVIVDLFDCAAEAGTSAPLPPTLYLTWVEITDHNNANLVYAKSLSAYVDVIDSDKTFNTQILDDGGYFRLQWGLVDAANNNAPLTCAEAGADGVEAIGALVTNPSAANSDIFDCGDNYGVTAGYVTGSYTVSVHALNAADQQLGDSVVLSNKTIDRPNKVTELGTVMVPID